MSAFRRSLVLIAAGLIGWFVGSGVVRESPPLFGSRLPYPHVVPKIEDGVSLRFAMVHDVLHERFPRHGRAYYLERNRLTRKKLDADPPTKEANALTDDLAVGLEFAGDHDSALQLMRDKLKRQLDRGDPRPELYSTYANLGTFLILGPFRHVRPGNEDDKTTLREGLGYIQTAVEINPGSHFGREAWQTAIIQYMIDLYENPQTLLKVDMVGNSLIEMPDPSRPIQYGKGRLSSLESAHLAADFLSGAKPWKECESARNRITNLALANEKHVPFDEPTLGIIGMWRLGGGAHPYFAIALGETMLRVNQKYLAWNAFERAGRMAEMVWPDADLQRRFRQHCAQRQSTIEKGLPSDDVPKLRPAFEKELAFGQAFQKAYDAYETEQIAAGKSIDDTGFYNAFWSTHAPIATPVGSADWFQVGDETSGWAMGVRLLVTGAFVLASAVIIRIAQHRLA